MSAILRSLLPATLALAVLGGCAYDPELDGPRPEQVVTPVPAAPAPASPTRVYFYPAQGQSEAQQDRDRYDCYVWAVDETGFDPARRIAPRETRASVVPSRSRGETVGAAAAIGAAIGAVAAGPGDLAAGAIVGGVAGAAIGAAAADAEEQSARVVERRASRGGPGRYEREATEYRRAMSACLEGRGYTVR